MPGASTDGRQAIRTFAEHEHEELAAGIGRIHELSEELATHARRPEGGQHPQGAALGRRRTSSLTWPGRSHGSSP